MKTEEKIKELEKQIDDLRSNAIKAEDDITILPRQESDKRRLGWTIFEGSEEEYQAYIKAKDGQEAFDQYLYRNNSDRQFETDKADIYRVDHHREFEQPSTLSTRCIPILQQLWGKPWNNEAINQLTSVRPSCARVVGKRGITLDSHLWRVTVYLEKDDLTIKKIEQEAEVGLYGHGVSEDVSENEPTISCFINDYSMERIIVE